MKFSAERQEKKGLFGGTYYETYIQVTLTPEEENVARKQKLLKLTLVGGDPEGEGGLVYRICNKWNLTIEDLVLGITAKVDNGSQLARLVSFENLVRERCKDFKSNIEADHFFGSTGSKTEEEL